MQKNGCVKVGKYHIRMMNEIDKKAICNWKYTGVYEVYNLPNYECLKKECVGFTNPKRICDYYVVEDDRNGLVAFFGLIEEDDEIFVGLGVHPNYCSKGIGTWVLEEAIKIKKRRYGRKKLYLEVRTWNKRAINCYKKAGFIITKKSIKQKTYAGEGMFCRMEYVD